MTDNMNSLNEITHKAIRNLGIRANKALGQNFLISDKIRNRILQLISPDNDSTIIEIGGGLGALSFPVVMKGSKAFIYEIDLTLKEWLTKELLKINPDVLVLGDFLKEYPPDGLIDRKFKIVGNIPYQITSPLLELIFESGVVPSETILMVQNDVARRISASAGSKVRGRLSIWCEYHADVVSKFHVNPGALFPQPKVVSSVIQLTTRDRFPFDAERKKKFFDMVKQSFSMKRKTIVNNLSNWREGIDKKGIEKVITEFGLDPQIRAEGLSIDDFVNLYHALESY